MLKNGGRDINSRKIMTGIFTYNNKINSKMGSFNTLVFFLRTSKVFQDSVTKWYYVGTCLGVLKCFGVYEKVYSFSKATKIK